MKSHDREPNRHTCPDIDSLQSQLENLRAANDELRNWGIDEANEVDRLEAKFEEQADEIKSLREEYATLEKRAIKMQDIIQSIRMLAT